jgi:hypothetical protein
MTSHWGGRAVSSMGLSPVSSVRSRLDYKINNTLGVKYLLPPEGKVNFLCVSCVLYCIFFCRRCIQPCLKYLDRVRTGGGPNSKHDVQSFFVISEWQTGEFAVLEPQALAKHAESLLDSRSYKENGHPGMYPTLQRSSWLRHHGWIFPTNSMQRSAFLMP